MWRGDVYIFTLYTIDQKARDFDRHIESESSFELAGVWWRQNGEYQLSFAHIEYVKGVSMPHRSFLCLFESSSDAGGALIVRKEEEESDREEGFIYNTKRDGMG